MATKDAASLLSKDFVIVKLDSDRAKGAKDIARRYTDKDPGLPWFAFLDGDGKCLALSIRPNNGSIGHPAQPDEVAHFRTMLKKAKKRLTESDIDSLIRSLESFNRAEGIYPAPAR